MYRPATFGTLALVLVISMLAVGAYAADAPLGVETVANKMKTADYSGFKIITAQEITCAWKPDRLNDGFKVCDAVFELYNGKASITSFPLSASSFKIDATTKELKNLKYMYSTKPSTVTVQKGDEIRGFINEQKTVWSDWAAMDDKQLDITPSGRMAVKATFEMPQYQTAQFNFTIIPLAKMVDPDVTACGTLNTPNEYYTLGANLTSDVDGCITITASGVTFDGMMNISRNLTCNNTLGVASFIHVNGANDVTLKNMWLTSTGSANLMVRLTNANRTTIIDSNITSTDYVGVYWRSVTSNMTGLTINNTRINADYGLFLSFALATHIMSNITVSRSHFLNGDDFLFYFTDGYVNDVTIFNNILVPDTATKYVKFDNEAKVTNERWNLSYAGNYYGVDGGSGFSDTCTDAAPPDGICDNPPDQQCRVNTSTTQVDLMPLADPSYILPTPPTPPDYRGLNITITNTWNTSVLTDFSITIVNTSSVSLYNTSVAGVSAIILNASYTGLPLGTVNITIYKADYVNLTLHGLQLNESALLNLTVGIAHIGDMVHIVAPTNSSQFSTTVPMDIQTAPTYGNIFTLKYRLNADANSTVNSSSSRWAGSTVLNYTTYFMQAYALNASMMYGEYNASVNFMVLYSQYNINIRDEMTGGWFYVPSWVNATLSTQCSGYINQTQLSGASTINFTAGCENPSMKLTLNYTNASGLYQYRQLLPVAGSSNLTFYMINWSNVALLRTLSITDMLGTFNNAKLEFKKAVPNVNQQNIIQQYFDGEGKAVVYLIDGETYDYTITSTLTGETRSSTLKATSAKSTIIITISSVPVSPQGSTYGNSITSDITFTQAASTTTVRYTDAANRTSSVTMNVYYGGNNTLLYTASSLYNNDTTLSWAGVPTNLSIRTELVVVHQLYGTWRESRTFYWTTAGVRMVDLGLADSWYEPMAIVIIFLVALTFSAYSARIGSMLTMVVTGMLWIWGWLPITYMAALFLLMMVVFILTLRQGERRI
jgi:hypothetical protein